MLINKTVLAICCAVLLGIGGCSRQQSDWQKTREANSTDAYEQFLKKYPSGEFSAQAQARLKEMYEERDWQKARDADTPEAYQAFLKQYPEGKWTEEARIRVENFTLAQTPARHRRRRCPAGAPAERVRPGGRRVRRRPRRRPERLPRPAGQEVRPRRRRPRRPRCRKPARSASSTRRPANRAQYAVQLGAFKSGHAAANERWEHLQKEYPKLLGGLSSKVLPKKTGGGTLYRLQAVGLSEAHARKICKGLRAKSQPCVIVRPAHRRSTSRD